MPPKISDKSPGEKLLTLYTLLLMQGERPISLASISSALGCSKQTVLRLIAQLEASGYGKLEEPLKKGKEYFYRLARIEEPLVDLGATEIRQLALCRNLLMRLLPGQVSGHRQLPGKEGAGPPPVGIMYKGYIDYAPFEAQYATILKAIEKRHACLISYQKSIFNPPRDIWYAPVRLISYHETLSVIGWEISKTGKAMSLYQNWLWLYLQRCKSVRLTTRSTSGLPDINLTADEKAAFGVMEGEAFAVTLLFNENTSNYIYDRIWSSDQEITLTPDKKLILKINVRSIPEIISWTLSFGPDVKVLEPAWLRDEIMKRSAQIITNNQKKKT